MIPEDFVNYIFVIFSLEQMGGSLEQNQNYFQNIYAVDKNDVE